MKRTLVQRAASSALGAAECRLDRARTVRRRHHPECTTALHRKFMRRGDAKSLTRSAALAAMLFLGSAQVHAVDGCKVLLCRAGNWSNISQCRPDVEEAFRQVARGRGWPTCDEGATANVANNQWSSQATCLAMYSRLDETGAWAGCTYSGMISVKNCTLSGPLTAWSNGCSSHRSSLRREPQRNPIADHRFNHVPDALYRGRRQSRWASASSSAPCFGCSASGRP